ncbi:penicillin-binding transpeptidase domain-containing protein, partial [Stomatohabitans albus]
MKRAIRVSALAVGIMFALLAGNLTYIQAVDPDHLADNPLNPRGRLERYSIKRGSILAGTGADQIEIARSVPNDGRLKYRREYPNGPLYATVTGYLSPNMGSSGLERRFDSTLQGTDPGSFWRNVNDWLGGNDRRGDNVITTIEPQLQQTAFEALGNQKGAVVALDPRNGDILAMVSNPTWDPNTLVGSDGNAVQEAWNALNEDPQNPRLNRATSELYPPGSTFKVVTASEFLEKGGTLDSSFRDPPSVQLPGSSARIGNSGRSTCAGGSSITLRQALVVSCNTT